MNHEDTLHADGMAAADAAVFSARRLAAVLLCGVMLCLSPPASAAEPPASSVDEVELGRRIYDEGILPSGAELSGIRFGSTTVSGAQAACANCHRGSGMGQVEGDILVPPITGNYLFAAKGDKHLAVMDPRVSKSFNQVHDPYTDATLAAAILRGVNNRGHEMDVAMPRFNLDETALKALTAYLRQLSLQWSPGVTETSISFATVITPDVDQARRKVMIDMMRSIIQQKNASTQNGQHGHTRHHMTSAAEMILGTERTWDLEVWELQGAPETWNEQLMEKYRSHPVFALLSGASGTTWQPVHDFCDRERIPCWFPSVDLPVQTPSRYSLYFSGGILLEAQVLARHLLDSKTLPKRLVQVYRDGGAGQAAAQEAARVLAGTGIVVENRSMSVGSTAVEFMRTVLAEEKEGDAVMFWLRQDDIAALDKLVPRRGVTNYFSSRLANAERVGLPARWRGRSHLVYLYELPEKRKMNLTYFQAWINMHKFPLVDEAMQTEVYFALNYMTDTIAEMLNNLYREYLVERAETMLDRREGSKSEQETRDRLFLGKPGDMIRKYGLKTAKKEVRLPISEHAVGAVISHGTTIYPHLSLGPGQRFSSKGGYVVRFADDHSDKLIDESGWVVP